MDRKPKSLPGTIRRKRKQAKNAGGRPQISLPKLVLGVAVLLFALIYTMGVLLFSLSMNVDENHYAKRQQRRQMAGEAAAATATGGVEKPPPRFLNLWPDDQSVTQDGVNYLKGILVECVPPNCVPEKEKKKVERVMVVRPPGQLGDILVEFVESYLEGSYMEVFSSTASLSYPFPDALSDDYYDVLIHVVSLPLLLEALDVLSIAAQPTKALLTAADVAAVARHLLQWHCRVAAHASDTPSITLTLDPTIYQSWKHAKKLGFLYNRTSVPALRDALAKKAMDRIDEGDSFWKSLLDKASSTSLRSNEGDLSSRVKNLIRQTMTEEGECPIKFPSETSSWWGWLGWSSTPLETLLESIWERSTFGEEVLDEN